MNHIILGTNGGLETHPTTETTTAIGWASQLTNNANTHAVIASEQSERGNLLTTENAPNLHNNNEIATP